MNNDLMASLLGNLSHPLDPPGAFSDFIDHPTDARKCVEIGVVLQHRFAFFYWLKWHGNRQVGSPPPNLLTIDWHDDVGGDCDFTPEELTRLDPQDENELALFCWAGLRSLNDGHIAPAQYLDAVGDVYVILKQDPEDRADEASRVVVSKDRNGKEHRVHYYDTPEQFLAGHGADPVAPLILDIDLDYFTEADDSDERGTERLVSDREIRAVVSPRGRLMKWVLPRLAGLTIALEPGYCGGVRNCMHALDVISRTLWDPPLLTRGMRWRRPQ